MILNVLGRKSSSYNLASALYRNLDNVCPENCLSVVFDYWVATLQHHYDGVDAPLTEISNFLRSPQKVQ